MTEQQAVERSLKTARAEIGYHEKASNSMLGDKTANSGSGNYTKYSRDLDELTDFYNGPKQGFAWCDIWYDWVIYITFGRENAQKLLCQPNKSLGAGCMYSVEYYRQNGQFFKSPQPGDQIFFTYKSGEISHTGIVESVSGGTVTTIEGNTSDGVYRRQYGINNATIYGYGRPDWGLLRDVEISEPQVPASEPATEPEPTTEPDTGSNVITFYTLVLRPLKKGDVGKTVKAVQILLIGYGHYCGGKIINRREIPDGDFGPSTENAVRIFQMANHLDKDGIVGLETMKALLGLG